MTQTTERIRQEGVKSLLLFIIFMDDINQKCNHGFHVGYRNLKRVEISECGIKVDEKSNEVEYK